MESVEDRFQRELEEAQREMRRKVLTPEAFEVVERLADA